MLTLALALVLAPTPSPAAPTPSQPQEHKEDFAVALIATRGLDSQALVDALCMRMPDLALKTSWKAEDAEGGPGTLFIDIHRRVDEADPEFVLVDIVLADGRAFRRQVRASSDDTRVVASFVSNLLLSIEARSVQADREGVPIPESSEAAAIAAVTDKLDAEDAPSVEAPPPEPEVEVAATKTRPGTSASPRVPWQIGPRAQGLLALALGPPNFADTLGGGGASLGLDARHEGGLLVDFDLRFVREAKDPAGLLRIRASLGAGYELRTGVFALPLSLAYTVETYRLDVDLGALSPLDIAAPSMLNGLRLRAVPSLRMAVDRGALQAWRIGFRGELAGSFAIDDGPTVIGIRDGESGTGADELFRLGALEMSLGLELGLDFGLRPSGGRGAGRQRSSRARNDLH